MSQRSLQSTAKLLGDLIGPIRMPFNSEEGYAPGSQLLQRISSSCQPPSRSQDSSLHGDVSLPKCLLASWTGLFKLDGGLAGSSLCSVVNPRGREGDLPACNLQRVATAEQPRVQPVLNRGCQHGCFFFFETCQAAHGCQTGVTRCAFELRPTDGAHQRTIMRVGLPQPIC